MSVKVGKSQATLCGFCTERQDSGRNHNACSAIYQQAMIIGRQLGIHAFANAILHGDDQHQKWLLAAATEFQEKGELVRNPAPRIPLVEPPKEPA